MEFCKAFNAKSQDFDPGAPCPTDHHVLRQDKSFTFDHQNAAGVLFVEEGGEAASQGGSDGRARHVAGSVTVAQVREIAEAKMKDLNANDIEAAMQIIVGSAKLDGS